MTELITNLSKSKDITIFYITLILLSKITLNIKLFRKILRKESCSDKIKFIVSPFFSA